LGGGGGGGGKKISQNINELLKSPLYWKMMAYSLSLVGGGESGRSKAEGQRKARKV